MSTPEESHNPSPLDLPDCWISSKQIGPIVTTYDGPSLVDSVITLTFSGGLTAQTATFEEAFTEEYTNRHIITFAAFIPGTPNTSDNVVKYKMNILYDTGVNWPIHYGSWKLRVLEI